MAGVNYDPTYVGGVPGAGYGLGSGLGLESLLLFGLLGRGRGGLFGGDEGGGRGEMLAGDVAAKVVELQNTSDLKAEVNNVKAAVIHDLQEVQADLQREISDAKLDAVKSSMESKIEALRIENHLSNKIGHVETEIQSVKCHVDNKIANSTQAILNQLNADKLDSKNDEIAALRSEKRALEQNAVFANQFSAINSVLVNLANQTQHLTNKVVQFGTGNVATPTSTNNQVG